jgi:hypothetical protein
MNPYLILLLCLCGTMLLLLALGSLPLNKEKEGLKAHAQANYESARGTAHKVILMNARRTLQAQIKANRSALMDDQERLRSLVSARDSNLEQTVTLQIVASDLQNVRGVGPELAKKIQSTVFNGSLGSLHNAYMIYGIGEQKQKEISAWVREQTREVKRILKTDFPGKSEIMIAAEQAIGQAEKRIEQLTDELSAQSNLMKAIDDELSWLHLVSEKVFEARLVRDVDDNALLIDRYQLGVFAPWAEPPGWFATAASLASSDKSQQTRPLKSKSKAKHGEQSE